MSCYRLGNHGVITVYPTSFGTWRLSNKVNTPGLANLTVLTMADCEAMLAAFGRCSALLHSEAVGLNNPLPLPDVVQTEITALKNWMEDIQQRQNAVR